MKLERREKILATAAGGVGLIFLFWLLFIAGDSRTPEQLVKERAKLESDIEAKERTEKSVLRDAKRLADWRRRSLPSDVGAARALYQKWLRELANQSGVRDLKIASNATETHRDGKLEIYTRFSYTLQGRISLANLTDLLYGFYSAGHLHQVRKLDLKLAPSSRELEFSMTVEAMSLPTADSKDQLSKEAGHGLRLAKASEYRDEIVSRNLFATYSPPAAPGPPPAVRPPKPTIDQAKYAFITGFTEVDGVRQVWLRDRLTDRSWILGEGQTCQIGTARWTVRSITPEGEAVLESEGQRRRLRDGDNLRGGMAVKD